MRQESWVMIGRSHNGWHAMAAPLPGYGECSMIRVRSSGGTLAGYLEDAPDGAWVYDGEGAPIEDVCAYAIRAPMADADVPTGHVRVTDWCDGRPKDRDVPVPGDGPLTIEEVRAIGGGTLDYVSIDTFVRILRCYPSVKIGRVKDRAVIWDAPHA